MFKFTDAQTKRIASMFNNQLLSDVTIILDDGSCIHAHKLLLYVSSEYFRGMFELPLRENRENKLTLSGFNPDYVRLCIKSIYDSSNLRNDISEMVNIDINHFGGLLQASMYLGLTKIHYALDIIGVGIFDKIWSIPDTMVHVYASILSDEGQQKAELADKIISKYAECAADHEYRVQLLNMSVKELLRLTMMSDSNHSLKFRLWIDWYIHNSTKDREKSKLEFDEAISNHVVNLSLVAYENSDAFLDMLYQIRHTMTYGFITMYQPWIPAKLQSRKSEKN